MTQNLTLALTIDGSVFAPGDEVTGNVQFSRLERATEVLLELRAVDLVHGTKVYRHPVASSSFVASAEAQQHRFALAIPLDALTRDVAPLDEPIDDGGWEVLVRIDAIVRAHRQVSIRPRDSR